MKILFITHPDDGALYKNICVKHISKDYNLVHMVKCYSINFLFHVSYRYDEELAMADAREREVRAMGGGVVRGRNHAKKLPTWK